MNKAQSDKMTKKNIHVAKITIIILLVLFCIYYFLAPTPLSLFKYENDGYGGIRITEYTGNRPIVYVPDTIDGLDVTEIGVRVFDGKKSLMKIKLPKNLVKIGVGHFLTAAYGKSLYHRPLKKCVMMCFHAVKN